MSPSHVPAVVTVQHRSMRQRPKMMLAVRLLLQEVLQIWLGARRMASEGLSRFLDQRQTTVAQAGRTAIPESSSTDHLLHQEPPGSFMDILVHCQHPIDIKGDHAWHACDYKQWEPFDKSTSMPSHTSTKRNNTHLLSCDTSLHTSRLSGHSPKVDFSITYLSRFAQA